MKKINLLGFMTLFMMVFFLFACGGGHSHDADGNHTETVTDKSGKEYTSAYVCPMHCEGSGSDQPGKCPVCKMDYVANAEHKADGHSHDEGDGHNHDDHEGHNH